MKLSGFLLGFRCLNILNQCFLCLHLRLSDKNPFFTISRGKRFGVLDFFLLDNNRFLELHPLPDDLLNVLLFGLDRFLLLNVCESNNSLPLGNLKKPILFNPLGFDRLGSFAVFLSDNNLSLFILLCDTKLLLGIDPGRFRFQAFFFSHLISFGLFTCCDGSDLPFLLFFRFCFLLIQLEYGLCCLDVLSFNFLLFIP